MAYMNDSPLFTFIVACYQTEPYLPKSLGAIARQTYSDFEAICYVEESTDNSLAFCQHMAESDSRFKVVSAPKSGAASATRNYGVNNARGKYLVVLDGDDWIVDDMLEKLAAKLEKTGTVDVLSFVAVTTELDDVDVEQCAKNSNFSRKDDEDGVFSGMDAIRRVGRNGGRFIHSTFCSIYRVQFMREHHLYQTEGLLAEDFESTARIWFAAEKFAYLDEKLYVYRRRLNSLTTEKSSRITIHTTIQTRALMKFAESHTIPKDILVIWSNQWLSVLYWFWFHPISSQKISDDDRIRAINIMLEGEGRQMFIRFVKLASWPRRISLPLILLAAKGILFPAKLFFQKFYYPMVDPNLKKKQKK